MHRVESPVSRQGHGVNVVEELSSFLEGLGLLLYSGILAEHVNNVTPSPAQSSNLVRFSSPDPNNEPPVDSPDGERFYSLQKNGT